MATRKEQPLILVVEDSLTQAVYLRNILERHDYRVQIACNGKEALELLKKQTPSLVISDIVMSVMGGYELCQKLKSDAELAHIPVMLLTSLSSSDDLIQGLKSGADNFIMKPFDEDYLIRRIADLLATQQTRNRRNRSSGITFHYSGKEHFVTAKKEQILDLLISTFNSSIAQNRDLQEKRRELKKLNQELEEKTCFLQKAKQAAEDATRAKSEFQANMSHEIRTPLKRIPAAQVPQNRPQFRILVVEDTVDSQNLVKRILEKAGYAVDVADNGQVAVAAVKNLHYDAILMDIQMPVMDGFTATQKIREFEQQHQEVRMPIIALTAHALQGYREKCLNHDMDDYLTKPIRTKKLLETIAQWIDRRPVILIVDDSECNRNLIANYVMKTGAHKHILAENGRLAVALFRRYPISLIFMDMQMPLLDGYGAARAIRQLEKGKDVPIIALTAHQGDAAKEKCLAAGCTSYLLKPIKKGPLLDFLKEQLTANEKVG